MHNEPGPPADETVCELHGGLPGSPVVKTVCAQHRAQGLTLVGELRFTCQAAHPKNTRKQANKNLYL